MQFLKTLFWVLVAVVAAVFAIFNWTLVRVNLWQDLQLQTYLAPLVIGAFLVGVLLIWLPHRAAKWSWRRKLEASDRTLAEEREARLRAEASLAEARHPTVVADPDPVAGDTVRLHEVRDADGLIVGEERDTLRRP